MRDRWDLHYSDAIEPKKHCLNCFERFTKVGGPIQFNDADLCEACFQKEINHVLIKVASDLSQMFVRGTKS